MIGLLFFAVLAIYAGVGVWGLTHFLGDLPKQPGGYGSLRYAATAAVAFMTVLFSWYLVSYLSTAGKGMQALVLLDSVLAGPPALWLLMAVLVGFFVQKRAVQVGAAMAAGAAGGFLILYKDWFHHGLKLF